MLLYEQRILGRDTRRSEEKEEKKEIKSRLIEISSIEKTVFFRAY